MKRYLLLTLALTACSHNAPQRFAPMLDSRPAIIFIPGYYGSALRNKATKERTFLTAGEIFFSNNALSLFQKELGTPAGPELEPDGLLVNVPVIPYLYSVDVYGKTLSLLSAHGHYQVVPFAYDWRADIPESAKQLGALVRELQTKGVREIAIVAHSMGGLVATYYLAYGTQEPGEVKPNWEGAEAVHQVAFLGTPFRGCFGIFRNLNRGANFSWNRHMLPTETVASFPASYQLLPFEGTRTLSLKGEAQPIPLSEFRFWEMNHLSLLSAKELPAEVQSRRRTFTAEQVARAHLLSKLLQPEGAAPASLRVLNVQGNGRNTVDTAYFEAGHFLFDTDHLKEHGLSKDALMAEGDAVVTLESSRLPSAFAAVSRAELTESRHDMMVADAGLLGRIMNFLLASQGAAKSASVR